MTRTDWRHGLGELARNVGRVVLVYVLVLQTLMPLAVARAEARDNPEDHPVVCSAMAGSDAVQPAGAPARIVHDCLACCLAGVVGALAPSTELPEPAGFPLPLAPAALKALVLSASAGGPPPQRAPPGLT